VIYDHPFSGDIAESGAFLPLEDHIPELAPDNAGAFIGPSLMSYWYGGHVWGVPIDGATQHAIYRRDLLDGPPPGNWHEVLELGARLRKQGLFLAQAFETPHTILSAGSLMANMGLPWTTKANNGVDIDAAGLTQALEHLAACFAFCPPEAIGWNSIDVHEQMAARNDLVYAPCIYGFATYGEADFGNRLSFAPFPGPVAPHQAGSAVGGTALGISRHSAAQTEALDFARFLASSHAQVQIIPSHHGQPAHAAAWRSDALDRTYNGFYSATLQSLDQAWVRPRIAGYAAFQQQSGVIARLAMTGELGLSEAVSKILKLGNGIEKL
jgi:multiple sugar transport system substrate-binding protein